MLQDGLAWISYGIEKIVEGALDKNADSKEL